MASCDTTISGAASNVFESHYQSRDTCAQRIGRAMRLHPGQDPRLAGAVFQKAVTEVFRTRLVIPDGGSGGPTIYQERKKKRSAFDLYSSIWKPRVKWCDARDLYDTEDVKFSRFELEWKHLLRLGAVRLIMRHDDDFGADEDGDGIPDEVEDMAMVLWENYDFIVALFATYASLNGELENMTLNSYLQLVNDCQLASKHAKYCKKSDLDTVFITVDSARVQEFDDKEAALLDSTTSQLRVTDSQRVARKSTETVSMERVSGRKKALTRVEFVLALVHIAIRKYVMPGAIEDVSKAFEQLLMEDIRLQLSQFPDPDTTRRYVCYTEQVCDTLEACEHDIKSLFESAAGRATEITRRHKELGVDIDEWLAFVRTSEVIGVDVSERDVIRCFAWSRMCVINGYTAEGGFQCTHLPFEGFMEALVRLSLLKALPTQAEVDLHLACRDAREYMVRLEIDDNPAYLKLMSERTGAWGGDILPPAPQERIKQLVDYIKGARRHFRA